MRKGQGVRTGLGHGGITCVLQTQFSSFFFFLAHKNIIFDKIAAILTLTFQTLVSSID